MDNIYWFIFNNLLSLSHHLFPRIFLSRLDDLSDEFGFVLLLSSLLHSRPEMVHKIPYAVFIIDNVIGYF